MKVGREAGRLREWGCGIGLMCHLRENKVALVVAAVAAAEIRFGKAPFRPRGRHASEERKHHIHTQHTQPTHIGVGVSIVQLGMRILQHTLLRPPSPTPHTAKCAFTWPAPKKARRLFSSLAF